MAEQSRLMVGKIEALKFTELDSREVGIFEADWKLLIEELNKIDPELGQSFAEEKELYAHAAGVAKGYFQDKPFGGFKAGSGEFGFRLITPQDFATNATFSTTTNRKKKWSHTMTFDHASSDIWIYLFAGTSSTTTIKTSTTQDQRNVLCFHKLISYSPSPRLQNMIWTVNRFPYGAFSVEPFGKIEKPFKSWKLIPMPGPILLHPGGELNCKASFDKVLGVAVAETFTLDIAPLGLVYAEYDYLKQEMIGVD
jgi:hypothetical protein